MEPDEEVLAGGNVTAAWNFVHGAGRAVFIDWDAAGPGSRLWDLAWSAHSFAGLAPGTDPVAAGARLRALVDGYGLDEGDRRRLVELLPRRYQAMHDLLERGSADGTQPWARLWSEGHGAVWRSITRHVERHCAVLLDALLA